MNIRARLKRAALALLAACFAGGCFNFETASSAAFTQAATPDTDAESVEHVVISNYGWFLFDALPLVCGNAKTVQDAPWTFFENEVTEDVLQKRLTDYARQRHCRIAELVLHVDDNCIFNVPGTSIPLMIPYLFTYREMQLSGVLVAETNRTGGAK